jgi:ABC-type glycerol-3-phosphate transport system substrate-binding protein
MRSISKGFALLLAAAITLSGCGKKEETQAPDAQAKAGPVKIKFWHSMDPKSAHGQVLAQIIAEFNQKYKDEVIVEDQATPSYTDLEQKITTALSGGGETPAIVQATDSMLVGLVQSKAVMDITSMVPADELKDYPESLLKAVRFDGKLMGLPFNKSMLVLIYDKNLVKEPPKTWEEFKQLAKQLTEPNKRYGTALDPDVYGFGPFYAQAGGDWLSPDGKPTFHQEAGVTALSFMVDLIKEGAAIQRKPKEYLSNYFNEGRAAMIMTTSASFAFIKPANNSPWGVAPLFKGPKSDAVPFSGANLAILRTAKPDEAQAAMKFILYATGKEGTLKWATGKTGYMPVRRSALSDERWTKFVQENPDYAVFTQSFDRGVSQPNHPAWAKVQKEITSAVELALLGQTDPKSALEAAAKKAEEILKK